MSFVDARAWRRRRTRDGLLPRLGAGAPYSLGPQVLVSGPSPFVAGPIGSAGRPA